MFLKLQSVKIVGLELYKGKKDKRKEVELMRKQKFLLCITNIS